MMNDLGSHYKGQFFTPYNIGLMIATINRPEDNAKVNDGCCGAGCLLIAAHKVNPNITIVAQDIDYLCCSMAYVQLRVLGAKGVVIHGDTLLLEEREVWEL